MSLSGHFIVFMGRFLFNVLELQGHESAWMICPWLQILNRHVCIHTHKGKLPLASSLQQVQTIDHL